MVEKIGGLATDKLCGNFMIFVKKTLDTVYLQALQTTAKVRSRR